MNDSRSVPRGACLLALALAVALASAGVAAQPAIAPTAAASAAERAQKESDRTMYWIRVLADRPAPVKAAPAAKAPAAQAARPVAEARDKPRAAAVPATTTNTTTTPAAAPKPAVPGRAAPADATDPSALSSTSADLAATGAAPAPAVAPAAPAEEPDTGLAQIKSVRPDFPGNVVLRLRKGHVEVRFEVEPGGTVTDAVVVSSTHAHLNQAALDAVRQWQFKPSARYHTAAVDLAFDIDHDQ